MPTPRQDMRKSLLKGDGMEYMSQSTSNIPDFQEDGSFTFSVKQFSQSFEGICCFENHSVGDFHDDTECARSNNNIKGRKKNFESFLMTGDRMINMAKTPANHEFRHPSGCSNRRSSFPTDSNAAKTLHMDSSLLSLKSVEKETALSDNDPIEKRLTVPLHPEDLEEVPSKKVLNFHMAVETAETVTSYLPSHSPESSFNEDLDIGKVLSCSPIPDAIDVPSACRLAKRLFNLEGFSKADVSRHLSKNDEFSKYVAEEYCKFFSFSGLSLDVALRKFLVNLCLKGETHEKERVLLYFSSRYFECNSTCQGFSFESVTSVHTLTCAIMLLNTDLHVDSLKHLKMKLEEFVQNLAGLNNGTNFPYELLKSIYMAIKSESLEYGVDEMEKNVVLGDENNDSSNDVSMIKDDGGSRKSLSSLSVNSLGGTNPFLSLPSMQSSSEYKSGYLSRKYCCESDRRKVKKGYRSWKIFYVYLRDMILYCFPDEKASKISTNYDIPDIALRVHHSLASVASDYTKRKFVFRLITWDQAEYLFQTSDQADLDMWIKNINTVVARYSCPPLPSPCCSDGKFQRPLYPSSSSKLTEFEQLEWQKSRYTQLKDDLVALNLKAPSRRGGSMNAATYNTKLEFLVSEIERLNVYLRIMEEMYLVNRRELQ